MKKKLGESVKIYTLLAGLLIFLFITAPLHVFADSEIDALKSQLNKMSEMMQQLQQKIEKLEKVKAGEVTKAEIKELDKRLNKAELHTATDKLSFGVELRTRGDSIHYEGVQVAPKALVGSFFGDYSQGQGFNGATIPQAQQMMQQMAMAGMIPPAEKYDHDNDFIFTNRLRLDMKAKVNNRLTFGGRLAMYKTFGDSSGVLNYNGNMGTVALDGNTTSVPHGDTLHVERAYFNYRQNAGDVPINFSLGRRPATEGAPLEYRNYSLVGGSPVATVINWQFDGASLNFGLEDVTDIPGAAFKLCYGVGFEADYGNYVANTTSSLNDVSFGGFIATFFDNDETSVIMNYAHAWNLSDGFTGTLVMPFSATQNADGTLNFQPNTGGYISRSEPVTNIGDLDMLTVLVRTNLYEYLADIDLFFAPSWSHTDPSGVSQQPFYKLMGQGFLSNADATGKLESHDGYMIYAGARFPMPADAKLGIEYNWGSEYWFNMTGAEDSLIGSKLATRGQVFEAYYIQPIYGQNFFVTLGGQYYDYEYTGSGNPLGAPVEISKLSAMDAVFPVVDEVWSAYLSFTLRY